MKSLCYIPFLLLSTLLFVMQPLYTPAVALDTGPAITMVTVLPAVAGIATTAAESAALLQADDPGTVTGDGIGDFLKSYGLEILFALLGVWEIIARYTPTKVDNSILSFILKILNAIFPNRKVGGGVIIPLFKGQLEKSK